MSSDLVASWDEFLEWLGILAFRELSHAWFTRKPRGVRPEMLLEAHPPGSVVDPITREVVRRG